MGNNYFNFKQFSIVQEKSAMKVGTDGVLLGSWVDVAGCARILDVGTGTGLIALMMAQRAAFAKITAVEIEKNAALEASQNIALSPWAERVEVRNVSFQKFVEAAGGEFDLIVSNPPFFKHSQKARSEQRTMARHNDLLPFPDLLNGIAELLTETGRCAFVLPFDSGDYFCNMAALNDLHLLRKTEIIPNSRKPANRVLLEFGREKSVLQINCLTIYDDNGVWSSAYEELTRNFYLYI